MNITFPELLAEVNNEATIIAVSFAVCILATLIFVGVLFRAFPSCGCCRIDCGEAEDWCICVGIQWCCFRCCPSIPFSFDLRRSMLLDMENAKAAAAEEQGEGQRKGK